MQPPFSEDQHALGFLRTRRPRVSLLYFYLYHTPIARRLQDAAQYGLSELYRLCFLLSHTGAFSSSLAWLMPEVTLV